MQDVRDKLITEADELTTRVVKLREFLHSKKVHEIPPLQRSLLQIQLNAMYTYESCLMERLMWIDNPDLAQH